MAKKPIEFQDFPDELKGEANFGPYRAVVKEWTDGDSLKVLIDIGFNLYPYEPIRIADINAPEKNRAASAEAGRAAKVFAESIAPIGTPIVIDTRPDTETFGRYVAYIMLPDGSDVGTAIVNAGHAVWRIAH